MQQEFDEFYQPGGNAWSPHHPDILDLLKTARTVDIEPIYIGSNHTFLVTLDGGDAGLSYAVYKPRRGEYPLHDFPSGTLYKREIATWLVACLLGWLVVPPTVETRGQYGPGSLQLFIDTKRSAEVELENLRPLALLDQVVNNADRKIDHCLPGKDGRIWGIDHGLTFHVQPKLRTILWHFAGEELSAEERTALRGLQRALNDRDDPYAQQLSRLISPQEIHALRGRVDRLVMTGAFPNPRYKAVPYRW